MAFELWPPSYLDLRTEIASAASPQQQHAVTPNRTSRRLSESSPILRQQQQQAATPSNNSNVPTPPRSKREMEMRAMLQGLSAEERAKKLHELTKMRSSSVLDALQRGADGNPPVAAARRSSPLKQRRGNPPFRRYYEGMLGCRHYRTNVAVSAPCCNEFFVCRFCHDANSNHAVDRQSVDRVQCMRCGHVQDFGHERNCQNCHEEFAHYFCHKCRLYDDDAQKPIFHCDACGVCRVGEAKDFFHCTGCNACLAIEMRGRHHCVENSLQGTCPVCACEMHKSLEPISCFPCGHAMHQACFAKYRKHSYRCPCCSKSLGDVSEYFTKLDEICKDAAFSSTPRVRRHGGDGGEPAQSLANAAEAYNLIACADCEERSLAKMHCMYHKCSKCGSYNTKVIDQQQ